jgi:hypothetical protein
MHFLPFDMKHPQTATILKVLEQISVAHKTKALKFRHVWTFGSNTVGGGPLLKIELHSLAHMFNTCTAWCHNHHFWPDNFNLLAVQAADWPYGVMRETWPLGKSKDMHAQPSLDQADYRTNGRKNFAYRRWSAVSKTLAYTSAICL